MVINISEIISRIKALEHVSSDSKVSDILGFKERRGLNYYLKSKTIPYDYLVLYAIKKGISVDWLLFGQSYQASEYVQEADKAAFKALSNILESGETGTILAIKQNLAEFEEKVFLMKKLANGSKEHPPRETAFSTQGAKRGNDEGGNHD